MKTPKICPTSQGQLALVLGVASRFSLPLSVELTQQNRKMSDNDAQPAAPPAPQEPEQGQEQTRGEGKKKKVTWSEDLLEAAVRTAIHLGLPGSKGKHGVNKKGQELTQRVNEERGEEELLLSVDAVRKKVTGVVERVKRSDKEAPKTGTGVDVCGEGLMGAVRSFIDAENEVEETKKQGAAKQMEKEAAEQEIIEAAHSMEGATSPPAKKAKGPMQQLLDSCERSRERQAE